MRRHKEHIVAHQTKQAIKLINEGKIFACLDFLCSIEKNSAHSCCTEIKYLAPKAYLLVLCGYDNEAVRVLRRILEMTKQPLNKLRTSNHPI